MKMSKPGGGGAEAHARSKQYRYRENSTLVLTTDSRLNDTHEPSGEPETLRGKIDPKSFGDRAARGKPLDLLEERKRAKRKNERAAAAEEEGVKWSNKKRRVGEEEESVLFMSDDDDAVYKPKSKETCSAYEAMLSLIKERFDGQPGDVLRGAADEVLAILKDDHRKNHDKKKEIEKLLNPVSNQMFDQLVSIGKRITDYQGTSGEDADGAVINDEGVAVEFDDEVEDEDSDLDQVQEESEAEEEETQEAAGEAGTMQMAGMDGNDIDDSAEGITVNVQDIDAYWLQRKISQAYGSSIDPQNSQFLAENILRIIAREDEDQDIERALVSLLEFDRFDLVKLLVRNRCKILWCTRLARAKDRDERKRIEEELIVKGDTSILEQLRATRVSAMEREKNLEKSIRQEARRLLKDEISSGEAQRVAIYRDSDNAWMKKDQRKLLDLERLAFSEGGLLMSNKKISRHMSQRVSHKGYEEVHVPQPKQRAFEPGEKLVDISDLPKWAQRAFDATATTRLNRVQSRVYDAAFNHSHNLLLCAPTGAGKTNVAVLAILQQIGLHMKDGKNTAYKIVYVAPMKALVAEVVDNLSNRLESYNVVVRELSGDQNLTRQEIDETHIIVTTPEKWDIVTRKSGDRTYTRLVKLLIIDEIHLLHDNRGPVLESIVARTIRQIEITGELCRLVGLSATLPNYKDVANFLRVEPDKGLFYFDNSYRPCPLQQQYIGITVKKPLQRFQLMNEICYEKVVASAGKHQVLVFVHSRKETAKTARAVRDTALANNTIGRFLKNDSISREILLSQIDLMRSNDLKELLPYGFAIHHAGLTRSDRTIVENLFRGGHIQVLVSTATLAWGVNLPAHTVIIKGTQVYDPEKCAWTELSPLDVMQMLGRAGRPQFDSYGEGIVITKHSELQYYLSLMNQQLPVESRFVSKLADQLNAEIVLGSVQNAREACTWLLYTYLFVRMQRNPTLYGLPADALEKDPQLEERRADLIHTAATILDKNNLIKYDRKSGYFQATDLGRIASYYYITHNTISTYNQHLKPTTGDIELCRLFSLSEEFKHVVVRPDEKIELAKLLDRVPIPVRDTIEMPSAKINVLLQAYISRLKLEGLSLTSDMVFIRQSAGRLLRALFEIVLRRGWAQLSEKALNLCKMVENRMWSVQNPLRQFSDLPKDVITKLEKKNLSWEQYYDLSSQELTELIPIRSAKSSNKNKNVTGKTVHKYIHYLPKLNLAAHVQPISRTVLKFELIITPDFMWDNTFHGYVEPFWVIVEDNDGENILHHEYFVLKKQFINEDHVINFTVPIHEPLPPQYCIRVVSDRWLGSETILPVYFRHMILPEKYAPPTELLDLQPLPVTALQNPSYEVLYDSFKHFNPIQTQVFTVLYNTDDNVLVAAPTGCGKTICAEFALLRSHRKAAETKTAMRVVYIAPIELIAKEKYRDWEGKFGERLGIRVVELTGETATDMKLLEKGEIVISTPEKWDALSRRWKQRKYIQQVTLFIVDELHLIGGEYGPVLEIIVARMRRISSQVKNNSIRIVALSESLANAKDLGEWIGATSRGFFNFAPSVRPVPLEIHIQGIDIANFDARMQAMYKPAYTAVSQHAKNGKPALIYVPTRKHVRLTAAELCAYAFAEHGNRGGDKQKYHSPFLTCSKEDMQPFINQVKEETLRYALADGVGYLHENLTKHEQEIIIELFISGKIKVCVASSSMCWGRSLSANLVVIMGTQYYEYDSRKDARTDYLITDLLNMMGHASQNCVILCHAPKKEYYKKFMHGAFPVESRLHHFLHDHMNAEVVVGSVESKQDAVDYLTWTFMYRRLMKNPNHYNLQGVTHRHLSDHLSDLVENVLADLESGKCVAIEENLFLKPLNLGLISSYYYISYSTVERFNSSLTPNTKMKGLLDILSSASEYSDLPIRPNEEAQIQNLIQQQRFSVMNNSYITDPHTKANALLQAHFSGHIISGTLSDDQREVLLSARRLIPAMVDVISSNGWLALSLLAMEVNQMVMQGIWERDYMLMQLPHVSKELARRCKERGIETVFDIVEMEESERREVLGMSDARMMIEIDEFCNRYPNVDVAYEVLGGEHVGPGDNVTLQVTLERDLDANLLPTPKDEKWWLVVGDASTDQLLAVKRVVALQRRAKVKLNFIAPSEPGKKTLTVYFMCDSYLGCDQEYNFTIEVRENENGDEMEMLQ